MGLLSEIFSGGNTLKRKLNALIKDPAGEINTGVIRAREDNNKLLNLFANAYPMAGDKTVLNSPQQIAQFQREAADTAANMGMAAATVWHGSPHKFDKFDSSKIGTGEGAQAYGHGLYLAESPDVARAYQSSLSDFGLPDGNDVMGVAKLISAQGAKGEARVRKGYGALKAGTPELEQAIAQAKQAIDSSSSLYKVDLPDEHIAKMLDWDKPLSEQAPEVQAALASNPKVLEEVAAMNRERIKLNTMYPGRLANPVVGPIAKKEATADGLKGAKLYELLSKNVDKGEDAASAYLRSQGIPGIRYLDGGSRGAGTGSSNFVVFPGNEGLLNIMERNGQPMNQLQKLLK